MRKSQLCRVDNWCALAEQAGFKPATLARLRGVSLRTLELFFQARARRPPRDWLNELRLWKAAERLVAGEKEEAVAQALHYSDHSHLLHRFHRYFKATPTEFVATHRRNLARWETLRDPAAPWDAPPPAPWTEAVRVLEAQLQCRRT